MTFGAQNSYGNAFFVPIMNYYQVSNRPYLFRESICDKSGVKTKETSKGYSLWNEIDEKVKGLYVSSYRDYKISPSLGGALLTVTSLINTTISYMKFL